MLRILIIMDHIGKSERRANVRSVIDSRKESKSSSHYVDLLTTVF